VTHSKQSQGRPITVDLHAVKELTVNEMKLIAKTAACRWLAAMNLNGENPKKVKNRQRFTYHVLLRWCSEIHTQKHTYTSISGILNVNNHINYQSNASFTTQSVTSMATKHLKNDRQQRCNSFHFQYC